MDRQAGCGSGRIVKKTAAKIVKDSFSQYARAMTADMHLHSRFSNGAYWPEHLAALAASRRIDTVCLTDHDTMGGSAEFSAAAKAHGIRAIPAVEVDCIDPAIQYKSELLAYFPEGGYSRTQGLLRELLHGRNQVLERICTHAAEQFRLPELDTGLLARRRLDGKDGERQAHQLRLSKTDIFHYLKERQLISDGIGYKQFKKGWMSRGPLSGMKIPKPSIGELSAIVRADGGYLVIPHIGHEFDDKIEKLRSNPSRLRSLLRHFLEHSVQGIELYRYKCRMGRQLNDIIRAEAERLGFFITWGSDYHGPDSDQETLGGFTGPFSGFPGSTNTQAAL